MPIALVARASSNNSSLYAVLRRSIFTWCDSRNFDQPPLNCELSALRFLAWVISRVIREMKKKKEEERKDKVGSGWSSFRWNRIFFLFSFFHVPYLEAIRDLISRAISRVTSHVPPYRTNTCQTFRTRQIVVIFLQQRGDDFFQSLARLFYSSRVRFGDTPVLFSPTPLPHVTRRDITIEIERKSSLFNQSDDQPVSFLPFFYRLEMIVAVFCQISAESLKVCRVFYRICGFQRNRGWCSFGPLSKQRKY